MRGKFLYLSVELCHGSPEQLTGMDLGSARHHPSTLIMGKNGLTLMLGTDPHYEGTEAGLDEGQAMAEGLHSWDS